MKDNNEKLKEQLRKYKVSSHCDDRWSLLCFAVGWQQGKPVPIGIIEYIDQLYKEDLAKT